MDAENEIIDFHRQLTEEIEHLKTGGRDFRAIQHFALLIARSALRQQSRELTVRQELAIIGV